MRKGILLAAAVMLISSCTARPFQKTNTIYDPVFLTETPQSTHVRIHRVKQFTGGGYQGNSFPLVLKVDNVETVGLQQNQYVDLYLPQGQHTLSIRFECAITEWRKSVKLNAIGNYQEYAAEIGSVGQYRILRIK